MDYQKKKLCERHNSEKNAKNCKKFAKIDKNARILNKNSTELMRFGQ
jgi:hypothetical protein